MGKLPSHPGAGSVEIRGPCHEFTHSSGEPLWAGSLATISVPQNSFCPQVKVAQSCPTVCNPMDYRVCGIF